MKALRNPSTAKARLIGCAVAGLAGLTAVAAPTALANHVNCGQPITEDTTLDENLNCTGDGLVIGAPRITLDLNGFTIAGDDGLADVGIDNGNGYDGITITGGTVGDFGDEGIFLSQTRRATLSNLDVLSNGRGVVLTGSSANTLSNVEVTSNGDGLIITDSSNRNRVSGGLSHVNEGYGIQVVGSSGTDILNPAVTSNLLDGIFVASNTRRTLIEGATASFNTASGIVVNSASTTITTNRADSNEEWGILAVAGVHDGGGNTASGNFDGQCLNVSCGP